MTELTYATIDFKGLSPYTVQNLINRQVNEYERTNRRIKEQEATRKRTAYRNSMVAQLKKLGFSPATNNDWRNADIDLDTYTDSDGFYGIRLTPRLPWSREPKPQAVIQATLQDKKRDSINRLRLSDIFELKVNITEKKKTEWSEDNTQIVEVGTYIETTYAIRKKTDK